MTRSRLALMFAVALGCLALPATARAQSAFAGVVKDATGAVLPGVTVEAASPALIEKVRSVTTDANGLYRIENLRPGTYTLTFNLPGFSAVKRDGVELPSNFTSTINAELKVGAMEETVTVSGQSPVVDVQSNSKAQVLSREVLDAVPTAHTIQGVGQLVVGVTLTAPDVGGSQAMQQTYFTVHGLGAAQTSLMMDGMIINGLQGDGAIQTYTNDAGNQEMVYQTGGGTVDSPTGGVKINMIPKEGGNRFSGSLFQGYETSKMQSDNLSPFLDGQRRQVGRQDRHLQRHQLHLWRTDQEGLALVLRVRPLLHRQQADRQHLRVRRHQGRHPRLRERAGRPRRHALPAGRRSAAPVQRPGAPHLADQPAQQAVGLLRPHPQGAWRGDERPATIRRPRRWCGTRRSTRRT